MFSKERGLHIVIPANWAVYLYGKERRRVEKTLLEGHHDLIWCGDTRVEPDTSKGQAKKSVTPRDLIWKGECIGEVGQVSVVDLGM